MEKKKDKKSEQLNFLAKYSGIGFKMLAISLVFVFLGMYLDKQFQTEIAWFTASFSILGVVLSVVSGIKDLIK